MTVGTGRVGLVTAIPQETEHLLTALDVAEQVNVLGNRMLSGNLEGVEVVLAEAGMGKVNTALVATLLAGRHGCRCIVFTGVAGGLDPVLSVGDVVVAERTVQHDTGVFGPGGLERYQAGHIPFYNPTDRYGWDTPPELLARVRERLDGFGLPPLSDSAGGRVPRIVFGTVLTGDQFLNSEAERLRLRAELGGSAIDMEGAALAQTAEALGIDHLVIRTLSDLAGAESTVDFTRFLPEVAANSARVVRHLLPVL